MTKITKTLTRAKISGGLDDLTGQIQQFRLVETRGGYYILREEISRSIVQKLPDMRDPEPLFDAFISSRPSKRKD